MTAELDLLKDIPKAERDNKAIGTSPLPEIYYKDMGTKLAKIEDRGKGSSMNTSGIDNMKKGKIFSIA